MVQPTAGLRGDEKVGWEEVRVFTTIAGPDESVETSNKRRAEEIHWHRHSGVERVLDAELYTILIGFFLFHL